MKIRPSYFKKPTNFILAIFLLGFYVYSQINPVALNEFSGFYIPELALVFALILLLKPLWGKYTNWYNFDIKIIQEKNGLFAPQYKSITPDEITSVYVKQTIIQQIFGVGSVDVICENTEDPEISVSGVRNPIKLQVLITDLAKRSSTGE